MTNIGMILKEMATHIARGCVLVFKCEKIAIEKFFAAHYYCSIQFDSQEMQPVLKVDGPTEMKDFPFSQSNG